MASDESMMMFSSMQEDEFDEDNTDDGFDHQPQSHNLSRLSVCTSSVYTNDDFDRDEDMGIFMSRLSIESFNGDADEEYSDEKNTHQEILDLSSDEFSDKEGPPATGFYSLPVTPSRRRRGRKKGSSGSLLLNHDSEMKEYGSENEAGKGDAGKGKAGTRRRGGSGGGEREREVVEGSSKHQREFCHNHHHQYDGFNSVSGDSEVGGGSGGGGGGGGGVMVITRPRGGRRSLCMDMEEVKACEDLGFELEHERMFERPNRRCLTAASPTSSGGSSPISNWRISGPGDNPRDVKARLKVWAHAVALASSPRHGS